MASEKSLAAEIEAVVCSLTCVEQYLIEADFDAAAAAVREASRLLEAQAAEIAALQSRAFEDGARWMRERAVQACETGREEARDMAAVYSEGGRLYDEFCGHADALSAIVVTIAALPLQPEGERNA